MFIYVLYILLSAILLCFEGKVAMYNLGVYSMSKFGVAAFSDVLRQEMRQWGVHVSLIEPGPYDNGTLT